MPELADVFRLYGPDYMARNRMRPCQIRAVRDITACRTEALGGHVYRCPKCRQEAYRYHSCKNRHCPKCQNDRAGKWIHRQQSLLLDVPYFMATFTLPNYLRPLARTNPRAVFDMLFQASSHSLQKLASDPRHIGGMLGMTGVLQTWTRDLRFHPHVHYIIPGGGISLDGGSWFPSGRRFLLPEKPLAEIFRAKFRDLARKNGLFSSIPDNAWKQGWVVDVIPVGTGQAAVKYLGAYIFRVAISNKNIVKFNQGEVTFRYRDSKTRLKKTTSLHADVFIRRFLQHVLPRGFQKVRTYGFMNPSRRHLLVSLRKLLNTRTKARHDTAGELVKAPSGPSPFLCRKCMCEMVQISQLPRMRGPP